MADRARPRPGNRALARFVGLLAWLVLMAGHGQTALAQDRIALVVGNGDYQALPPHVNASADAWLVARALEGRGFEVTLIGNADLSGLTAAIAAFGQKLSAAGSDAAGLFYFAGRGGQSGGRNYLLGVDARPDATQPAEKTGVPVDAVMLQMALAGTTTGIIVLEVEPVTDTGAKLPFEGIGLGEMTPDTGQVIAFAAAPGTVPVKAISGYSLFTRALTVQFPVPDLPIVDALARARDDVVAASAGKQTPWAQSALGTSFAFSGSGAVSGASLAEEKLWNMVSTSHEIIQIRLFLQLYPNSRYHDDAQALLDQLTSAGQPDADIPDFVIVDTDTIIADPTSPTVASENPATLTFTTPLFTGGPGVEGFTLELLAKGTPLFSPLEGIPEALWKGQSCANCHAWTREALCTQGGTYLDPSNTRIASFRHPYGGGFKQALRTWAGNGCR